VNRPSGAGYRDIATALRPTSGSPSMADLGWLAAPADLARSGSADTIDAVWRTSIARACR